MCDASCTAAVRALQPCGSRRGAQSEAILLICCCHIVCTVFCGFSVCLCPVCILCEWPVNGLPKASDCPQPHFACLLFVHRSPFVGWSASQWVARQDSWHLSVKMKGGFRDGYWTLHDREVSCYSPIQSPPSQLSSSPLYMFVFSKTSVRSPSATRKKGKSTSRSTAAKMLMNVKKETIQLGMFLVYCNICKIWCFHGVTYIFKTKFRTWLDRFINYLTDVNNI